jgi:hypothetical protein
MTTAHAGGPLGIEAKNGLAQGGGLDENAESIAFSARLIVADGRQEISSRGRACVRPAQSNRICLPTHVHPMFWLEAILQQELEYQLLARKYGNASV